MKKLPPAVAVHRLSLYNPSRLTDAEIIASFAARSGIFERILQDIQAEKPRSRPQHHLIVGQRGMGKSTLLARLAAELRKPEFVAEWIPLVFAEEQYAVDRLSKFWLNCLDSLADAAERAGNDTAMERIDAAVQRLQTRLTSTSLKEEEAATETLAVFLNTAKELGQRPVLLVDNLQMVFERLNKQQQHVLREVLMRPGCPLLLGASPSPPPENQDYGAAFYDHFKVHYLRPLELEEMRALMLSLAEASERPDVRDRILQNPSRLAVLRQLTGGNPRTTVTLFFLYAEDFAPSAFADLENLLDRVTPLYKARFEELTAQQQVIASAVANHWYPVTGAALAAAIGLPAGTISPQLDRLERTGFIEKVDLFGESRTGFQIAERFFNVWFLMRSASRRQRRDVEFLTRFIETTCEPSERPRLARQLMREKNLSPDRHLYSRALAATLPSSHAEDLKRHAELDALRQKAAEARQQLEEVIDFSALEPATLKFDQLRVKLMALVPSDGEVTPEEFAAKVLGDRGIFQRGEREQLAAQTVILSKKKLRAVLRSVQTAHEADEADYGNEAVAWFSSRLAAGLLRSIDDFDDWARTIEHAIDRKQMQLIVDSLPSGLGERLTGDLFDRIREAIKPDANASATKWYNWGYDLAVALGRFTDAEQAYREAIARGPKFALPWNNLGNLLQNHLARYAEAEHAYREAIARDPKDALPWNNLGNLLQDHLARYSEAEQAYREAIACDPKHANAWNGLGNLRQDYLGQFAEAEEAYLEVRKLEPTMPDGLVNLLSLRRDFMGDMDAAIPLLEEVSKIRDTAVRDVYPLHQGMSAIYATNWGQACAHFDKALEAVPGGFPYRTTMDWMRASAVLLHLNYGKEFLAYLEKRGTHARLRPWYEALKALHLGDRRYLQNVAPEVRPAAEKFYDEIECRLKHLPEKTRRRPVTPTEKKSGGGKRGGVKAAKSSRSKSR